MGLGLSLKSKIRNFLWSVLPAPLFFSLRHRVAKNKRRTALATAAFVERIDVQSGAYIETYWSDVPGVGRGPSASLYVLGEEVLRLDCFGGNKGHMHLNPEQIRSFARPHSSRIFFEPGDQITQINRAKFELLVNSQAALTANALKRIRRFQIDNARLTAAAEDMHSNLQILVSQNSNIAVSK